MRRRVWLGVCTTVVLSLATLVSSAASSSGAASAAPGVTAKEVVVGLVNPNSGAFGSQFAAYTDGVKARVYMANKAGGINGRKIRLEIEDDAGDPTRSKAAFDKFANGNNVFGIIAGTFWIDGVAADLSAKGIPITGWGFTPSYKKFPNMFGESASTATTDETIGADTVAKFARSKGATKMATLALADPFGPPGARVQAKVFEKLGGTQVFSVLDLPLINADFTAIIQKIKDSGADYISGALNQQTIVSFAKAMQQAGIKPKVSILGQGYQEDILKALGPAAEGQTYTLTFAPFELKLPASQQYLTGLAKVAPGEPRGIQSMTGWLGADVFLKGLEVAGKNPTRQSFITNLRQVHDYNAGGLEAPFDFSTVQTSTQQCWYFVTVHNGKFVPDGKTAKCGKILTGL
jgi:branched-chain amino acid transport system substrate-binding protein